MIGSNSGILRTPGTINFGCGSRFSVPEALLRFGNRIFMVTDEVLADTAGFRELIGMLQTRGVNVSVYTEVTPELPNVSLNAAARAAAAFGPDAILGYGGGSSIDAAKLVGLLLKFGGPLSNYYGENVVPAEIAPVVAVPTTAGTGSEVTPVAVISDPDRAMKVGISSPHLIPRVAIVDPELTINAPAKISAFAGVDALVHAIESYTVATLPNDWSNIQPVFLGKNALSTPLSLEATRCIGGSLVTAVVEPDNIQARINMSYGSLLAGIAFGSTGTHLSHALQYPIGALTHTPHGLGTGLMIPYVLEACASVMYDKLAQIGIALGIRSDDPDMPHAAIDHIAGICERIQVPASLRDIGIEHDRLYYIAERALESRRLLDVAPIPVNVNTLLEILEAAFKGERECLRK